MSFYVGSCRYLKGPEWKQSFPARLHTTKEMIYFFENIKNIKTIMKKYPEALVNRFFGDITHSAVKSKTNEFLKTRIDKSINKVFLEVCSRKICYYTDPNTLEKIPVKWTNNPLRKNNYTFNELVEKYNITCEELSNEEIEEDLLQLLTLVKKVFNLKTKLYIIPNIDLKLKTTNNYIPKRHDLVDALTNICNQNGFHMVNIGKFFENKYTQIHLENVMPDGGSHFHKKSKKELIQYLNEIIINQ